jgi:hypothetical protein
VLLLYSTVACHAHLGVGQMDGDSSTQSFLASYQDEESAEEHHLDDMDSRDYAETQENLTHASHSLTDTLHRLQQLRNSLAELTDSLPSPHDPHVRDSNQDVGPAHAAIVLSDRVAEDSDEVPEMRRLRSTIPSTIMERLEEYEADSRRHLESTGRRFTSGTLRTPISRQSSNNQPLSSSTQTTASVSRTRPTYRAPPFPDLVLPARRSWLEASLSRHQDANPDESSTALGRRVAARATAGGGSSSENAIPQLEQIFLSRTTEMARDLETAVNRLAAHRATGLEQRVNEALRNARSLVGNSNSGAAPANEGRTGGHLDSQIPNRPTNNARTWRFGSAPSGSEDATLSNHNVSTATTTVGPRPRRLFREDHERPLSSSAATAAEQAREADNRSYLIRRRLNADGDEQIHNIHSMDADDDTDDPMEWLMPPLISQDQNRPDAQITASRVSRNMSPFSHTVRSYHGSGIPRDYRSSHYQVDDMHELTAPEAPRRRRGWGKSSCSSFHWVLLLISSCPARLDADGNEVATEVDAEIERAHVRSRVRALAQVRESASSAAPTLSPIELGAIRRETLVPMTRTSITHTWNDDDGVTARVRINPPRQTFMSPLTADTIYMNRTSSETHPDPRNRPIHSSRGYFDTYIANPLPMPLVDMIPDLPTLHKPSRRTVSVHKYANLAGR